jgi:hypothetical protein
MVDVMDALVCAFVRAESAISKMAHMMRQLSDGMIAMHSDAQWVKCVDDRRADDLAVGGLCVGGSYMAVNETRDALWVVNDHGVVRAYHKRRFVPDVWHPRTPEDIQDD